MSYLQNLAARRKNIKLFKMWAHFIIYLNDNFQIQELSSVDFKKITAASNIFSPTKNTSLF